MKRLSRIIVLIVIAFLVGHLVSPNLDNLKRFDLNKYPVTDAKFKTKLKSGNLATDYSIQQALDDVKTLGLNTVNIPIVINIESLSSSKMQVDDYSVEKAKKLIKKLKPLGINVILEAYPWIDNGAGYETNWKPDNIEEFFYNWKNNVLGIIRDKIAIPYRTFAMNIASNFVHMEKYHDEWKDILDFVKSKYSGFTTYRTSFWYTAHWDEKTKKNFLDKMSNPILGEVDFISVAAYFELTDTNNNSVEELEKSIQKSKRYDRRQEIKNELYEISKKYNKPLFFGELGFPRTEGATIEPWNPEFSLIENNIEQANAFEAYRRSFEKEPWHLGFSVFALGERSEDKKYYPSNESKEIIKNWYTSEKDK